MDRTPLSRRRFGMRLVASALPLAPLAAAPVEVEESVYEFTPADNGAGPMWAYGAPGLVRRGQAVFATGLETIPGVKPLHNCRWVLYRRDAVGWERALADEQGRQREPCPLAIFGDGRLLLSSNPTRTEPNTYNGPADPQILTLASDAPGRPPVISRPVWRGTPRLTEHTYRGMAVDARRRQLLVLHNDGSGAPQAHWSFLDAKGTWRNQGVLTYPVRGCYPQVALAGGAAHVLAVGDIVEPVAEWRKWKFEKSGGRQWDYVFRRLFYSTNPQVGVAQFRDVLEVDDVEGTAGHITNLDLWLDRDGAAHILYLKRSVASAAMRDRFFPGAPLTVSLEHCVIRNHQVASRQTLLSGDDAAAGETPVYARFHARSSRELFVVASVRVAAAGTPSVYQNRLLPIAPGIRQAAWAPLNLRHPFMRFITATERGGSQPSAVLDLLGQCPGAANTIRYARVRLDRGRAMA